jgi:uncharacterized membrane protein YhaH (DUF805 family)
MQNDYIEMIESTPKLKSKRCRAVSFSIWVVLRFGIYVTTALSWYIYDYFIAFFILILSYIVMGIIRSKLRNTAIPSKQLEYTYSDKEIADWYTSREICIEYDE